MNTNQSVALRGILAGFGLLVLAFLFWETRDFVPSFAATEVTAKADVTTTAERDDARVFRAFERARATTRLEARLETDPDPSRVIRNGNITLRAASGDQALADLATIAASMRQAFTEEGPGELLILESRGTFPVPNSLMNTLSLAFRGIAALLGLVGLGVIWASWRASGLPKQVLWGVLITISLCAITLVPEGAWPTWLGVALMVMPIPMVFAILVFVKTRETRRAGTWTTSRAVIKDSRLTSERRRFAGDAVQVKTEAEVTYEFTVDGEVYEGTRISIGVNPAGGPEATIRRYAKGTTVPVFYNPANPAQCVLERDLPVSLGCLWTGVTVLLLIGAAITAFITHGESINQLLATWAPGVQNPLMVLGIALMGVFCLLGFFAGRKESARAAAWPVTQGQVVASEVDSFITSSENGNRTVTMYQPLVEYRYEVKGQSYRGIKLSLGALAASSNRTAAEQQLALYPVGKLVNVHYDPENPSNATLDTRFAKGGCLLIFAAGLFGLAWFIAHRA